MHERASKSDARYLSKFLTGVAHTQETSTRNVQCGLISWICLKVFGVRKLHKINEYDDDDDDDDDNNNALYSALVSCTSFLSACLWY